MSWFDALLLGILQGLTEFLPVSSSGHLVVFQHLLGMHEPQLAFDVAVHVGTLLAVVAYYRKLIADHVVGCFQKTRSDSRRLLLMIIAASIPTGLIGVLLEEQFERLFASPFAVSIFWILTGLLLIWVPSLKAGQKTLTGIRVVDAVIIGFAQGLAIIPGVSRSGATIAAGMMRGVQPADAAGFSFLLSIPAILGATLLQFRKAGAIESGETGVFLIGFLSAAVVGYAAIALLIRLLNRRIIRPFGWYCIAAGAVTIIFLTI